MEKKIIIEDIADGIRVWLIKAAYYVTRSVNRW